jgi:hypothetical protein
MAMINYIAAWIKKCGIEVGKGMYDSGKKSRARFT